MRFMKGSCSSSALLVTDRVNRRYFSGVDIGEGFLFVADEKVYFTDGRYFLALKDKLAGSGVKAALYRSEEDLKEYIDRTGIKTLYVDYSTVTVEEYKKYKTFGVKIKNARPYIDRKRSVKSKEEIGFIKRSCEIVLKAYYDTLPEIKEGVTERELKNVFEKKCADLGAEAMAFDTIVAFGENSAVPHHETGDTKLKNNSAVLIDAGTLYKGYASDLTRTAFFGEPDEKFLKVYDAVLKANILAEENIRAGTTCKVADGIARAHLEKAGYKDNFTHSLGHGVGLEIHEFPYLSPRREDKLKNGNVFTVEPGVYFGEEFGVRIEDTVLLKGGKVERLFDDDKKPIIIK